MVLLLQLYEALHLLLLLRVVLATIYVYIALLTVRNTYAMPVMRHPAVLGRLLN
jgi:hypothetical protein